MSRALIQEAWAGLCHRSAATVVSVGGLMLALTMGLVVAVLLLSRLDIDPTVPSPDRVVMFDMKPHAPDEDPDWQLGTPVALAPLLKARGLPVDLISRSSSEGFTVKTLAGGQSSLMVVRVLAADPDLAPLMGIRALHGDLNATLSQKDAIAVTPNLARKLWGELPLGQALGRSLDVRGRHYTVTAVIPAFDTRSTLDHDHEAMASYQMVGTEFKGNIDSEAALNSLHRANGQIYARLRPGGSPEQLIPALSEAFQVHPQYAKLRADWKLAAGQAAAEFRVLTLPELPRVGQPLQLRLLTALGGASGLLLLLALINTMNLQAAQLLQRRRETALRRSLGATSGQLLKLWCSETLLTLLCSAAGAALLAWWLSPAVSDWLGLSARRPVVNALPLPALLGLALVVVLAVPLTLALPASMALRQVPAPALQGRTASEGPWGRRIRQGLLSLQLVGALLLLAITGMLALQHHYLVTANRGIETRNRLILSAFVERDYVPKMDAFVQGLRQNPAIERFAFSSARPALDQGGPSERHVGPSGSPQMLRMTVASPSFFDTYGMKVLAGNPYTGSGEGRLVIDAKAAHSLGFANPQAAVGQLVRGGGDIVNPGNEQRRVVAVVSNIKQESPHEEAKPQAFLLSNEPLWDLTVYGPDIVALRQALESVWKTHGPALTYMIWTADEQRAIVYQVMHRLTWVLGAVALLAVGVAMLGAYALVADTLRRRRTELVLHRLHGASHTQVARAVAAEFARPLTVALLLGVPLAALAGHLYRADYVDRLDLATGLLLPLALAVGLTLLATSLAALRHVVLALRLQPIEALR